jgi:hypothetical protein
MVHLRSTRKLGFVLMEAPPGMNGRFFVAVEPYEQERWAQDMPQGTVKDNVRDELNEATGRGRRDREDRKEATPEEVRHTGSGGVKDNVQDEWAESQKRR